MVSEEFVKRLKDEYEDTINFLVGVDVLGEYRKLTDEQWNKLAEKWCPLEWFIDGLATN